MYTPARRADALLGTIFLIALLCALLLPVFRTSRHGAARAAVVTAPAPLRALIVGGGPDKTHNQVAIESNVRYVHRLLPPSSPVRILFTNGDPQTPNVQYLDADGNARYRASDLSVDGPSRLATFHSALEKLSSQGNGPLLLYFTGHGSPDDSGDYTDNAYDMWDDDELTVKGLAASLEKLPPDMPVTVVMVQCFSGAFGNLLFKNGDPDGPPIDRPLCGFFASVPQREAAGCTAEVNEADYHDFTSYFFAALSGRDRLGRAVTGADYNGDGMVGMNEAYDYTLLHDISIDTPTCTSDIFLRRFVPMTDDAVFKNPYSSILGWASPGQRAVLDGISSQLGLTGEKRLQYAYSVFRRRTAGSEDDEDDDEEAITAHWTRLVRCAKSVVLAHALLSGTDDALKSRYAALVTAEAANPLHNAP